MMRASGMQAMLVLASCVAWEAPHHHHRVVSRRRMRSLVCATDEAEMTTTRVVADTKRRELNEELLDKVREYLSVREMASSKREEIVAQREAVMASPVWQFANYLLSLESLLPEVPKDADDVDPLDYAEMARWGYSSLVEEIMDAGGRVEVSRALGVQMRPAVKPPPPPPKVWRASDDESATGQISLGAARDSKIDDIAAAGPPAQWPSKPPKQKKPATVREPRVVVKTRPRVVERVEVPLSWPLVLAPMSLGPVSRVYATLFFACLAADPSSRATQQALQALSDSASVGSLFETLHVLSFALLAANVAAAALAATRPRPENAGDDLALRIARALVGGPLSVLGL